MSLIPDKCIESNDKRNLCVASEKGKTFIINNSSKLKIKKVKIDKCLSQKIGEKRCDYLMTIDDKSVLRAIYIELKGGNLSDAFKQLEGTIIYLKNEFKKYQIDARIVGSRDIPRFINNPSYLNLAKEVIPTGGKIIKATNKIYTENI